MKVEFNYKDNTTNSRTSITVCVSPDNEAYAIDTIIIDGKEYTEKCSPKIQAKEIDPKTGNITRILVNAKWYEIERVHGSIHTRLNMMDAKIEKIRKDMPITFGGSMITGVKE